MTDVNPDLGSQQSVNFWSPAEAGIDRTGLDRTQAQSGSSVAAPRVHELMSPEQNVQRIMWTGTIWFGVAVGAAAIVMGLLLSSGWRPALLTGGVRVLWWIGAGIVTLSIGLIGWSGCPILEVDVPTADRNKTHTMQLGTMLFIVGGALALLAVLIGPVQ